MENKYNNSKIYKIEPICEYEEGEIYIGSTCEKHLSNRMSGHRANYKRWLNGIDQTKCNSYDLFDKYGIDNCKIILLEKIDATCKEELLARESHFIRNMKCLNTVIPDRTAKEWHKQYYENNKEKYQSIQKEYYQENKEYINNRNKLYQENNKDKLLEYSKQYREENKEHKKETDKAYKEANKEKIKERKTQPFLCECGCTIQWDEKARHKRSKKHLKLMEQL